MIRSRVALKAVVLPAVELAVFQYNLKMQPFKKLI
jgi:hypothetical protein